jgi:biotin carboxyl carrier protein
MLDVLTATDAAFVAPETTVMRERVVVAPCSGRFRPLPSETFSTEGEWVEPGAVLAEIDNNGATTPVRSSFRGWVMGMLALEGQPVKAGEALFWISSR